MSVVRRGVVAQSLSGLILLAGIGGCNAVFGIHEGAPPPPCYDPSKLGLLIDDMEDGMGDICDLGGRHGGWYTQGDGTSTMLEPAVASAFAPTAIPLGGRGQSHYAARFSGSGFTDWGALMGFELDTQNLKNDPYDASSTGGIKFWMKSDVPVAVNFLIPQTVLLTDGGLCAADSTDPNCNSHFSFKITAPSHDWTEYEVPFSALTQQYGGTATWNPQVLLGVQFLVAPGAAFDVWVDDVSFYRCTSSACKPTCNDPAFPVPCAASGSHPAACLLPGNDCSAIATWCSDPLMIDDMEDGDASICNSGGRQGFWYTAGTGTAGTLSPAPGATFIMTPISGGRGDSRMAAHMTASGLTDGGAVMGFLLRGPGAMPEPYDASATDGIRFWMKTDAINVQLLVPTAETLPMSQGGLCSDGATEFNCGNYFSFFVTPPNPDEWIEYKVPYSALYQVIDPGNVNENVIVGSATWDPTSLDYVLFGVGSTESFDLWVDDVSFYNDCSTATCLPTCTDPTAPVACPALGKVSAGCWPIGTDCSTAINPLWDYRLLSLWGSGSADLWAVGFDLRGPSATTLHWNGSAWSSFATDGAPPLWDVWGSGSADVWAVGDFGTIVHWTGSAWSASPSGVSAPLRGVWGSGSGDVWVVGANGIILHGDGSTWSPSVSGTTQSLFSVWGSGPKDLWAVGAGGTVLHGDGTAWVPFLSSTTADLARVWGSGPKDVWAVGSGGTILHWDSSGWSSKPSGVTSPLRGLWGSAFDDVWAVGDFGVMVHWDGGKWTSSTPVTKAVGLQAVWGTAPDDVWAVSYSTAIVEQDTIVQHYDGSTWSPVTLAPTTH